MRDLDDIPEAIINAAIQIHRDLGPGLLEFVSEAVSARAPSPSRRVSAPPRDRMRRPLLAYPSWMRPDGAPFGRQKVDTVAHSAASAG